MPCYRSCIWAFTTNNLYSIMDAERLANIEALFWKNLEENAIKYPDIADLVNSFYELRKQGTWSKEFLDGYLACISDLTFAKKRI